MGAVDQARTIQRLAQTERWVRFAIYFSGTAALGCIGWQRGPSALPILAALVVPSLLLGPLLLRFIGAPVSYHVYSLVEPETAARMLVGEAHARRNNPRARWREALWWLRGYLDNVIMSIAVGFAIDALGGTLLAVIGGVCAMLTLNGVANALHLRMRFVDAHLTFTLPLEDAAGGPAAPTGVERTDDRL